MRSDELLENRFRTFFSVLTTAHSACCYIEDYGFKEETLEVHFNTFDLTFVRAQCDTRYQIEPKTVYKAMIEYIVLKYMYIVSQWTCKKDSNK